MAHALARGRRLLLPGQLRARMKIAITGAAGFLGCELTKFYFGKEDLVLIVRPQQKKFFFAACGGTEVIKFDFLKHSTSCLASGLKSCDVVIHTAHSLKLPPSLPAELLKTYQQVNPRGLFVYIGSLNTIIPALASDPYTRYKKECEEKLLNVSRDIPLLVIRPSFIVSPNVLGRLETVVNIAKKLHMVFLLTPGPSHYFLPVRFLAEEMDQEMRSLMGRNKTKVLNIVGNNLTRLSELIKRTILGNNIHAIFIPISTRAIRSVIRLIPIRLKFLESKMKLLNNVVYEIPSEHPSRRSNLDIDEMIVRFS